MDEYLTDIEKRFKKIKEKKILIYGTGKIARNLLVGLKKFNIVGIVDRFCLEGKMDEIPILTWEDFDTETADAIILATTKNNYKEIYDRIIYQCAFLDIIIYGENGKNLSREYQMKYIDNMQVEYFQKNENELKKYIDKYDAISFSIFDTLLMRKVLEATDIFDIVEARIRQKGIQIRDFRKKRKIAETQSGGSDIYQIYSKLQELINLNKDEMAFIMQEEIACEKECLIPRKVMIEILNHAFKQKKKVSFISDTYLPRPVIEEIIRNIGILDYYELYTSSDYKKRKENGLFGIYHSKTSNMKCLHIGSDNKSDMVIPKKYGIDTYSIKSAYDLLKISSLRKALVCRNKLDNNIMLGLIISELFNNPFALYNTFGCVIINNYDVFAKIFITPLVILYLQMLRKLIQTKKYDAILFSSRDGYIFQKIFDKYFLKDIEIPTIYFLTSRKLSLTSTVESDEDVINLGNWNSEKGELKVFLNSLFQSDSITLEEVNNDVSVNALLLSYKGQLRAYAVKMRENYKRYMEKNNISLNGKYLICDLCSSGTIQEALNKIFSVELEGFYLCRTQAAKERKLKISHIYNATDGNHIVDKANLLETILTSIDPSVQSMNESGEPGYAFEVRTSDELNMVTRMQKAIMKSVAQYVELGGMERVIDKELPDIILGLCENIQYKDEIEYLMNLKHVDDMNQRNTPL